MQLRHLAVVTLGLFSACTKDQPPVAAQPAPAAVVAPAPVASFGPDDLSGTVVETMNSGGYTYAKLERGGAQVWVAGPETKLAVGAQVGRTSGSLMSGFRSDTLNRTFDQIYFVSALPVAGAAMAAPHPAVATAPVERLAPLAGGVTVADVFAGKDKLSGKPIALRAKVVKVNNGILGKNWLHVQDGSGAAGTNDLVVTTAATVAKDDVVVVHGTVATNKDFGAGYSYAVMIEDATIAAK